MKREPKAKATTKVPVEPSPVVAELKPVEMSHTEALGRVDALKSSTAVNFYHSGISRGLTPQQSFDRVLAKLGLVSFHKETK